MVDLIRLPNGTVITPQELSDEERLAYLEALIHLSAPVLARLLAGIGPTSGDRKSESKDSMAATREKYADLPPVLTIDEAAKVLAVSKSTVYEMTRRWQGKFFPHFRIGNRIRVPRDKLVEWINAGGIEAYREEIQKADAAYERSKIIPKRKY